MQLVSLDFTISCQNARDLWSEVVFVSVQVLSDAHEWSSRERA
jgi:hypothetical protein